jgi:transposase-like protein
MVMTDIFSVAHFRDDTAAREYLQTILWPEGPICPHCGVVNHAYATKKPGVFRCAEAGCRKDFTVTMRTVMERSKIALHKWLQAFHLMCSSKKGISAHQLHRTLDIGYEAAWFMCYRIREAMRDGGLAPLGGGGGIVEADETTTADGETVAKIVRENIERKTRLHTDESRFYGKVGAEFAAHETVNHSAKKYARGDVTTNSVEAISQSSSAVCAASTSIAAESICIATSPNTISVSITAPSLALTMANVLPLP